MSGGRIATIIVGLARSKVLAVLLGPAGIGLMGVLQSVMSTSSTLFGLGLRQSAVRQISASGGDLHNLRTVRKALSRSNFLLGFFGLVLLWAFRGQLSVLVFDTPDRAADVGWMGAGVLLTLVAATHTALMQGLRRLADMVKAGLVGSALGTVAGIALVWSLGLEGVRWFVLSMPAFTLVGTLWYARKLPASPIGRDSTSAVWTQWREMASLGSYLMLSTLVGGVSALVVRSILTRELGIDAAGQFQAAIAISGHYLGLILGAMAADYFPRLSENVADPSAFVTVVNEQLEVALLLVAPLLLSVLALAPLALTIVYSPEFTSATGILRWQIVADVLKVVCWSLGFMILARGEGPIYLFMNVSGDILFMLAVFLLVPRLGLEAAGIAFLIQMAYSICLIWWFVGSRYQYVPTKSVRTYFGLLLMSAAATALLCNISALVGGAVGVCLSSAAVFLAYASLKRA